MSYVSELRMYVSFINRGVFELWCIGDRSSCGVWVAVNILWVSCPKIIGWCVVGVSLACVAGLRVWSRC